MAAQWDRLKTGLGIGPEPVQEPESLPSQLLHQLDEATTLSKTQVLLMQIQAAAGGYLHAHHKVAQHAVLLQRVYGFAICLGLGLLFGFLVSNWQFHSADLAATCCSRNTETALVVCSPAFSF